MPSISMKSLLCIWVFATHSLGMNVLLVPTMATSHIIEFVTLGEGLVSRGHQVSIVVGHTFPKMEWLREARLKVLIFQASTEGVQHYDNSFAEITMDLLFSGDRPRIADHAQFVSGLTLRDCNCMMSDEQFMDHVRSEHYDIAVVDGFSLSYCSFILPYTLKVPFASAYSGLYSPISQRNPSLPSFSPHQIFEFKPPMTFVQRVLCFLAEVMQELHNSHEGIADVSLLQKYAPDIDSWLVLMRKSVLFLLFKDHILEFPEAAMPNVIFTPGITVRPAKALPSDFERIMQKTKETVVLVAFGSLAGMMPRKIILEQLQTFKLFRSYSFIMRMAESRFNTLGIEVPDNVIIKDWIPIQDILAHPKTKLFITHGGNNGQWESVYHGVPMICFPLFAEQHHNCERAAAKHISKTLDIHSFTSSDLHQAIEQSISDPLFANSVQFLSELVRSRPMTPVDTAAYWLEHVNQFGGEHLRSVAMDMPLYQFLMLDIIGALLAAATLVSVVVVWLTRLALDRCLM